MALIRSYFPNKTEEELDLHKESDFATWLQFYVSKGIELGQEFPTWLVEIVNGLNTIATSYPRYCSRGYAFRIQGEERSRSTSDYGVSTTSGDLVYYGILKEILEVRYPGMLDLRCIVFLCEWYDPLLGSGVEVDQFGVTSVNSSRRLQKYDPFILGSQADQVCYIRYPRLTNRSNPWVIVTTINPRGRIHGVPEHAALQPTRSVPMDPVATSFDIELVVDITEDGDDIVHSDSEEDHGEFYDSEETIPSEGSSSESE